MPKVAVCGRSLLLSLVADLLSQRPGMSVVRFEAAPAAMAEVAACAPDVALVEQGPGGATPSSFIVDLLRICPDLPIVGLDPEHSVFILLPARRVDEGGIAELAAVIEEAAAIASAR